jgi:energy-converting hydrogenase A subunit M
LKTETIYSFVYRGHLARTAVSEAIGHDVTRGDRVAEMATRLPIDQMDEDIVMRAREMAVVYTAIAAFENSARTFVQRRLLEVTGDDWWEKCVPEKRRQKAETRRDEENKIRWHAKRGESLLEYTEIEDLSAVITTNQDAFLPFIGSVDWSKNIFNTVERSRNIIMHSGALEPEDVERLALAMRDWLNQIGG